VASWLANAGGHEEDDCPPHIYDSGYQLGEVGSPATHVWKMEYYDNTGTALPTSQREALEKSVSATVYNGGYYHYDLDSICSEDGLGAYGQSDGSETSGGGGFVVFPSTTSDPATGSDHVFCDNDHPHGTQNGSTESETVDWEVIANGLMTHVGVQQRSDDETSDVDWETEDTGGAATGGWDSSWVWVR
jgi:hypothetical protein